MFRVLRDFPNVLHQCRRGRVRAKVTAILGEQHVTPAVAVQGFPSGSYGISDNGHKTAA